MDEAETKIAPIKKSMNASISWIALLATEKMPTPDRKANKPRTNRIILISIDLYSALLHQITRPIIGVS
jgi:hypothetical protein